MGANNAAREAIHVREIFTSHFFEEGAVSWQHHRLLCTTKGAFNSYSYLNKSILIYHLASLHSYFQVSPEMFDRVQVRTLARPLKDMETCPETTLALSWLCA